MLSIAERHKYILDSLNKHGFVRITDVANELGVTKVTIRKDIKILESKGLLYKVHGSARPANPHVADLDVHVKDNINRDAKRRIAQRAAEMLGETDSIIVASGSTVYAFAEEIKMRMWHHLNIVTPFLRLGVLLNESENVNVVQLGGSVHKKSLSVLGEEAARELDDCICSKVFFGVDGIDPEHGITTSTIDEAKLTRRMMHAASQVIVLADSSNLRAGGHRRDRHRRADSRTDDLDHRGGGRRSDHRPIARSPGRAVPGAGACRAGNPRTCAFRPAACGVRAAGRIRHVEKFFRKKCCRGGENALSLCTIIATPESYEL